MRPNFFAFDKFTLQNIANKLPNFLGWVDLLSYGVLAHERACGAPL